MYNGEFLKSLNIEILDKEVFFEHRHMIKMRSDLARDSHARVRKSTHTDTHREADDEDTDQELGF